MGVRLGVRGKLTVIIYKNISNLLIPFQLDVMIIVCFIKPRKQYLPTKVPCNASTELSQQTTSPRMKYGDEVAKNTTQIWSL